MARPVRPHADRGGTHPPRRPRHLALPNDTAARGTHPSRAVTRRADDEHRNPTLNSPSTGKPGFSSPMSGSEIPRPPHDQPTSPRAPSRATLDTDRPIGSRQGHNGGPVAVGAVLVGVLTCLILGILMTAARIDPGGRVPYLVHFLTAYVAAVPPAGHHQRRVRPDAACPGTDPSAHTLTVDAIRTVLGEHSAATCDSNPRMREPCPSRGDATPIERPLVRPFNWQGKPSRHAARPRLEHAGRAAQAGLVVGHCAEANQCTVDLLDRCNTALNRG